ncbi:MAG TPA: diacylglycerol kinase family protein [Jatrophihabitantaceae bacterium]
MTAVPRPAVVCNPVNVDDIDQLKKEIRERCTGLGISEPLWFETTLDDPGAGMVRDALRAGVDLVLVCGGDGTVAQCAGALAGSDVPLALIPVGSGNLLARNLDLPLDRGLALDVALGPDRRRLDLLESDGRRFVVMAGLGFDAAMIRDTDGKLKAKVGWPAYIVGGVRALRGTGRALFEVRMDDQPVLRRTAVGVLVGNVGRLQGGLAVLPEARPDDGLLDVLLLTPHTVRDWPMLALRILLRRPASGEQAQVLRGSRVQITADRSLPLEYDGDDAGNSTGITVRVLSGAIVVCAAAT